MSATSGSIVVASEESAKLDSDLQSLSRGHGATLLLLAVAALLPFLVFKTPPEIPLPPDPARMALEVFLYAGIAMTGGCVGIRWAVKAFSLAFGQRRGSAV